jgi:uncharacterized NAD(P)/FAD-binding protein YdhS
MPVVIVGAGSSGTLLALQLARRSGPPILLIERGNAREGCGVAFGTRHPAHVLNVRAAGMSAYPDEPGHFARWLATNGGGAPTDFVPRGLYGRYLCDLLAAAKAAQPGRITSVTGEVLAISRRADGYDLALCDARTIAAAQVVLSPGNLPPTAPEWLDEATAASGAYIDDPWADDLAARLPHDQRVVILGTGLSAVDAALRLHAAGFAGEMTCLSRRGLTPHRHLDGNFPPVLRDTAPEPTLSVLVRDIRARAAEIGWHAAVDGLRPVTQQLWQRASIAERARFLRHLRPYWDVHRHRLAPVVADTFRELVAAGRLRIAAGKISAVRHRDGALAIDWLPRRTQTPQTLHAGAIVNCTGPQTDIRRTREPLLRQLLDAGFIRPDPLALGIDVDAGCRVIGGDGKPLPGLYCIGPMTRGTFWEIVAVPDIRRQCAALAEGVAAADARVPHLDEAGL